MSPVEAKGASPQGQRALKGPAPGGPHPEDCQPQEGQASSRTGAGTTPATTASVLRPTDWKSTKLFDPPLRTSPHPVFLTSVLMLLGTLTSAVSM